jgi:hypothetical protein
LFSLPLASLARLAGRSGARATLLVTLCAAACGGGPIAEDAAVESSALAGECPATCRVSKIWFTEVSLMNAVTELADGHEPSDAPFTSSAALSAVYSLTLSDEQVEGIVLALDAGCPANVKYSTRGQLLRSGEAEVGYHAHIETRMESPTGSSLIHALDLDVEGPPTPNGSYRLDHVAAITEIPVLGDSLMVWAEGGADAEAVGSSTADYGSAYIKLYRGGVSGAPMLEMCVPE